MTGRAIDSSVPEASGQHAKTPGLVVWWLLGSSWALPGGSWNVVGSSEVLLGGPWGLPGSSWVLPGAPWVLQGDSWKVIGRLL